jgi:transmembrane sensor
MNSSELKLLFLKYKDNRCTTDDLKELQEHISNRINESEIKKSLHDDLENYRFNDNKFQGTDLNSLFGKILAKISEPEIPSAIENQPVVKHNRFIIRALKISAALIPVFLSGALLTYIFFNRSPRAELITYNEITAPYGARSEITLPDGSSVWLNAGSKIKYMNVFNKKNRDIFLEGEAYFKVAKNKLMPFNVKTGNLNIEAVGTEFNVKSYDEEKTIETTLVEGKIIIRQNRDRVKSGLISLEPHQKAVYFKDENQIRIQDLIVARANRPEPLQLKPGIIYIDEKIDPEPIIAWKDNRLIMKGEELNSLLVKLERKYDVKFTFESDGLKQFRFTGTLENETLTQVLDVIKLSAPIEYELEGKNVKITENKLMMKKFSNHLKKK